MGGDDERRARDCLEELPPRRAAGEDLLDRVGARARSGPRWARVFERLGVPDPYDAYAEDQPLGLGPVGVKLADRRRPAPHARPPKDPNAKVTERPKQPQGRPKPVRLAEAPKPPPKPPPPAPKPAAPEPAAPPKAESQPVGANPGDPVGDGPPELVREVPILPGPHRAAPKTIVRPEEEEQAVGAESVQRADTDEPVVERAPPGPDLGLDDLFGFSGGGRMKTKKAGDEEG